MGGAGLLHWMMEINQDEKWEAHKLNVLLERSTAKDLEEMLKTKDGAGSTPIHWACNSGNVEGLQIILDHASKHLSPETLRQVIEIVDEVGEQPIHYAALSGHTRCLSLLLSFGAFVDAVSSSGNSPLHYAAMNRHYDCLALLMEKVHLSIFFFFSSSLLLFSSLLFSSRSSLLFIDHDRR